MISPPYTSLKDTVGFPIYQESDFCWITWKDSQTVKQMLKGAGGRTYPIEKIRSFNSVDPDDEHANLTYSVYEIACKDTKRQFYLICALHEFVEYDDIYHCICVPRNYYNLLIFIKDFLVPLRGTNITF